MAEKQLILVVEGTAAMGPHWQTMLSEYLDKIIRSLCDNETTGQKLSVPVVELSLVVFNAHGNNSGPACIVQRSGWTRDANNFLQWLSDISFYGNGFGEVAIAEGLAEALMLCTTLNGKEPQQNVDRQRHCILVAASNLFPLSTPVIRQQIPKLEQSENIETQTESRLSDAETLAKLFPQLSVSLSVICPKQLPEFRAIYDAGKHNPRAADPSIDNVKNPCHLVLISENFIEALAALSWTGITCLASNMISSGMSTQMVQNGIRMNQDMMRGVSQSGIYTTTDTMMRTSGMGQQAQPGPQSLGMTNKAAANMPLPPQTANAMQSAQSKYVRVWEGNLSGQRQGQPVFITRLEGYRRASASEPLAANWPPTMHILRLIPQDHLNNKQYVGKADFLVFRAMNQHGFLGQLQEKKLCAVIQLPSQTLLLSVSDKACRLIGMLFPGDMDALKLQISNQQQQHQHPQLQHQELQQLQQQPLPQLQQQQQIPQMQPQQQMQQQQVPQMQQHIPHMQQPSQQQQMVWTGMAQAYVQGQGQGRSQMVTQGQVTSQGPPSMPGGGGYLI